MLRAPRQTPKHFLRFLNPSYRPRRPAKRSQARNNHEAADAEQSTDGSPEAGSRVESVDFDDFRAPRLFGRGSWIAGFSPKIDFRIPSLIRWKKPARTASAWRCRCKLYHLSERDQDAMCKIVEGHQKTSYSLPAWMWKGESKPFPRNPFTKRELHQRVRLGLQGKVIHILLQSTLS